MHHLVIVVGDNEESKLSYIKYLEKFHGHRSWWVVTTAEDAIKYLNNRASVILNPGSGEFDTIEKRAKLAALASGNNPIISRVVVFGNQTGDKITAKEGLGIPYGWASKRNTTE